MLNQTAATGAILQMLSHGLMTALFFALIGMIYGRTHTRDVRELTGLMKVMPFLSVCYVIAGLANLGLAGIKRVRCRNDYLRRFFPEQRRIPPYTDHHRLFIHRDHGSLYPASGR